MWERLTESARAVILQAQKEASELNSTHIDPPHLLLGLLSQDGVARSILMQEVRIARLISACLFEIQKDGTTSTEEAKLSYASKVILETAAAESKNLSHAYIGTEHFLLALAKTSSPAQICLDQVGLTYTILTDLVASFLSSGITEVPDPEEDDYTDDKEVDVFIKGSDEYQKGLKSVAQQWDEQKPFSDVVSEKIKELEEIESLVKKMSFENETPLETITRIVNRGGDYSEIVSRLKQYRVARSDHDDSQYEHWLLICKMLDDLGIDPGGN